MYCVYGDESYDAKRERVFAVAGLFGSEVQWNDLVVKWTEETRGQEFHAAQWQTNNRHEEYRSLVTILANSGLNGWGAVMSLLEYADIFDNAADNFLPYYFCFIRVLQHFGDFAYLLIPREKVKFTFDQNLDVAYNAGALYDLVAHLPEWEHSDMLENELSFSNRKNPRIQAADLWAYEVMKHMDNTIVGPVRRPMRLSLQALRKTNLFGFDMIDSDAIRAQKKYGIEHPRPGDGDYPNWCKQKGLIDNTTTRIRYEIYLREVERGLKPPDVPLGE